MQKNIERNKAVRLGVICTFAYLACYCARNILSAISPKMIETSAFTVESIGTMSSLCMIAYAVGQLINGTLGDRIKSKYMVCGGLFLSGVCNFLIPHFNSIDFVIVAYTMSGFFLSMIFAPITKVVAENTLPKYASRCCLGFTVASFLGNPAAGLIAILFSWKAAFLVSGIILVGMSILCYLFFSMCERKGYIRRSVSQKNGKTGGKIKCLLENQIVKFAWIAVLTGIIRTTVVFWVPTYAYQHLGFSTKDSAVVFTIVTLAKSCSPYINNLLIYEKVFKRNMNRTLLLMFSLSAVCFALMYLVTNAVGNIILLVLALMTSAGASTMMFSVYCPSLKHTGMVSAATGFLDFISYAAASVANQLFSRAAVDMGWGNLILIWAALMVCGVIVSLPYKRK